VFPVASRRRIIASKLVVEQEIHEAPTKISVQLFYAAAQRPQRGDARRRFNGTL
jgi:hypothetical protein